MEVFVKSFSTYRTVKKATAISSSLVLDALSYETSSITVAGTGIDCGDAGSWLIADGRVFRIANVKPEAELTVLTLDSPLDAFSRPLELEDQPTGQTVGGFISGLLQANWAACNDPVYAMPYLSVSNSDTTALVLPDTDGSGCFNLPDYCRLMRKTYRATVLFADAGIHLSCTILNVPAASRQIPFDDGRSELQRVAFSSSGLAKITALQDVDTGEKDANSNPVYRRERTVWYLSEDGEITQEIPARRAQGEWGTIHLQGNADVRSKVAEAFAKNKANHKLEFWSSIDLAVQTDCTFSVYGQLLRSYISYKRKSSTDNRFYYKSGELATTATEKLKGVLK